MVFLDEQKLFIDWTLKDFMHDTVDLLILQDSPLVFLCTTCGPTSSPKLVAERNDSNEDYFFDVRCVNCKAG